MMFWQKGLKEIGIFMKQKEVISLQFQLCFRHQNIGKWKNMFSKKFLSNENEASAKQWVIGDSICEIFHNRIGIGGYYFLSEIMLFQT